MDPFFYKLISKTIFDFPLLRSGQGRLLSTSHHRHPGGNLKRVIQRSKAISQSFFHNIFTLIEFTTINVRIFADLTFSVLLHGIDKPGCRWNQDIVDQWLSLIHISEFAVFVILQITLGSIDRPVSYTHLTLPTKRI